MFTKHVGYMGNCIGDFFKQCNMYCGKSALLKGQKTGVILQEICAICTWDCKFTPTRCKFTPIPSIHLACDLFLECKKCQKLKLSDIVFSAAAFPKMAKGLPWNLDYKPQKGDKTGFNIVNNDLKNTNWKDKKSGKILSRKRAPKTMRDFAQLNKPEQSHILSQIFEALPLAYNKSLDQYGKQFQRYMKKLYKQQFEMCTPAQQLKLGEPRKFDLYP